jgi:hypothetical protein
VENTSNRQDNQVAKIVRVENINHSIIHCIALIVRVESINLFKHHCIALIVRVDFINKTWDIRHAFHVFQESTNRRMANPIAMIVLLGFFLTKLN